MRLIQFTEGDNSRRVGLVADDPATARILEGVETVYALAMEAIGSGLGLADTAANRATEDSVSIAALAAEGRLLPPLDHPDPAHLHVTGTGLTHLGSAEGRDKMHRALSGDAPLSDSMKMFKIGLEGGKPAAGETGAQPEWFYKGDGAIVAAPGHALSMPDFALDGGEEPEIAGLYVIGSDGTPWRLGYALANEFSDHVLERQNYLYLAHSKLRMCSFGPELLLGDLPQDLHGTSRILREGSVLWEAPFVTGEENMCHTIANLEGHHFKYGLFRRPGDAHCHFFGTATLSFTDNIETRPGDEFEISIDAFGSPLRNRLERASSAPVTVKAL